MTWTTTATLPERKTGAAWYTAATLPERQTGIGWFTAIERIPTLTATGTLSANVATSYPYSTAVFSSVGSLSAVIKPVKTVTVAFTAAGALTSGTLFQSRAVSVAFTATTDGLTTAVNEGLWATISGGTALYDGLSATISQVGGVFDGLSATVTAASVGTATRTVTATITGSGVVSKVGTGTTLTVTATITGAGTVSGGGISDDFNRADSSSGLGSNWTNRANTMGISSNAAYTVGTGAWSVASHNTTMAANDMEASITLGTTTSTGNQYAMVGIGANSSGEMVFADTASYDGNFHIYSVTDWALGGLVDQATIAGPWTTGDVVKLKRVGNVYTLYLNGSSVGSWTDSGNVVPRDSSHRYVSIGAYDDGTGSRRIDSFAAL